ncbi:MAG: hypothetical protein WD768_05485 [Phycisphaeraceae bacterium]
MIRYAALVMALFCVGCADTPQPDHQRFISMRADFAHKTYEDASRELRATLARPDASPIDKAIAVRMLVELDVRDHGLPDDFCARVGPVVREWIIAKKLGVRTDWALGGAMPLSGVPEEYSRGQEVMFSFDAVPGDDVNWLAFSMRVVGASYDIEDMLLGIKPAEKMPAIVAFFGWPDTGGYWQVPGRWFDFEAEEWREGTPWGLYVVNAKQ